MTNGRNLIKDASYDGIRALEVWTFLERALARHPRPVRFDTIQMDWGIPVGLASDLEAWPAYWWCGAADLARAASEIAMLAVDEFLRGLELFLVEGRLLPAASMARALLEHAVMLDAITDHLVDPDVTGWVVGDSRSIRPEEEFPISLILPLWKSVFGGRYPWETGHLRLTEKQLKRVTEGMATAQRAENVLTLVGRREKAHARRGLLALHAKLCDVVHPSRGSREVLFFGHQSVDGRETTRLYDGTAPSDETLCHRASDLAAPAVVEAWLIVQRHHAEFMPRLDQLGHWSRESIRRRGYDLADLNLQERIVPSVREFSP